MSNMSEGIGRIIKEKSGIANPRLRARARGFTLLEVVLVVTILSILTAAIVPLTKNAVRRQREIDLRYSLRQIREAIDAYKRYNDMSNGATIPIELRTQTGYPKELKTLVEGFIPANVVGASSAKVRFLRRMPIDPMTGDSDWGKRSYKDKPDASDWGGEDVYDVYSKSQAQALDGTYYKDW